MEEVLDNRMQKAWAWKKMDVWGWSRRSGKNEDGESWIVVSSEKEHVDKHTDPLSLNASSLPRGTCVGESGLEYPLEGFTTGAILSSPTAQTGDFYVCQQQKAQKSSAVIRWIACLLMFN